MNTRSRVSDPQQARSRESLERVMEAGLEVLTEDGWNGFAIAKVCERAGVSVGTIYRRFHSREDLLAALQDRWLDDIDRDLRSIVSEPVRWSELDAAQAVRIAVNGIVEGFSRQEALNRVIGLHGPLDDNGLARLARVSREYAAWYRSGLVRHADAFAHDDPARAVDFSYRVVLAATLQRATHGDEFDTGTSFGDWKQFAHELWSVNCAYLFHPPVTR